MNINDVWIIVNDTGTPVTPIDGTDQFPDQGALIYFSKGVAEIEATAQNEKWELNCHAERLVDWIGKQRS